MTDIRLGKLAETIYVTVLNVKRLRGTKGDVVTSYAKVEFDGKSLGDSAKVESTTDTDAEYNFTTSFDCSYVDGAITLNDVASKPVIISIVEVLPKEKKQKEEKVSILSQCSVDLFPLFNAHEPLTFTLELYSVLSDGNADTPKAEATVTLSVKEPLIDPDQQFQSNLLSIRLGSVYSIPDAWSTPGAHFNYIVGLPIPTSAEKDTSVLFSHGTFKPAAEKELVKRPVKWPSSPNVTHCAQYIPNSARERIPISEEKGELCGADYADFRRECETERNRITWDAEKRCYLPSDAKTVFQNRIALSRFWPIEILRTMPTHHKEKGGKKEKGGGATSVADDDGPISYHGVAYVDLAALLYPGVCSVAGAFRIHPYNESELMEKTKQKNTITDDVLRVQSSTSRATGISPIQKGKGGQKDATLHVPAGKKGSALRPAESIAEVADAHFTEASAFVEHKTYAYIELNLSHPLVPRRKPEELAQRVSEYIPPRPTMKRVVGGADKAVEDYHSQLSSVAAMVLDEFRHVCGDVVNEDLCKLGEMKKELMYQLNSTGKYFAFKEQLKHSIVKIVREKYMKTTTFKTNDELQQFLTELYVFLIDEMHASLQKVFSVGSEAQESIEPVLDSVQLKRFAQEAEVNEDYVAAAKYYQERLTKDDKDPEHWLDYGAFNLHAGNHSKAKHCFEQTVAIQQDHLEGLLLYGVMSSMDQEYEQAETMLQRAVSVTEEGTTWCSLAWAILALFYDSHGNEIRAEHAFLEAHRLNLMAAVKKHEAEKAAEKAAEMKATPPEQPPAPIVESENESEAVPAETRRIGSSKAQSIRSAGSTAKGSRANKNKDRARSAAECSFTSGEQKTDQDDNLSGLQVQSIFLLTASWLLDHKALKFAEIALSKELLETRESSQADYYIALSRLQLMSKQYDEALNSLNRATAIDHQQPDAWAMMGHVNYVSNNIDVAQDCYERTLAFVDDASEMHSIYLRLASIYLQKEEFTKAKNVFLLACKYSPTSISWLGVGNACYRLNEIVEAEDALAEANILNNSNAEVWAYLSLVCLKTNRKLESEQAYKYALRLGLQDENLLTEIHSIQKQLGFGNPSL